MDAKSDQSSYVDFISTAINDHIDFKELKPLVEKVSTFGLSLLLRENLRGIIKKSAYSNEEKYTLLASLTETIHSKTLANVISRFQLDEIKKILQKDPLELHRGLSKDLEFHTTFSALIQKLTYLKGGDKSILMEYLLQILDTHPECVFHKCDEGGHNLLEFAIKHGLWPIVQKTTVLLKASNSDIHKYWETLNITKILRESHARFYHRLIAICYHIHQHPAKYLKSDGTLQSLLPDLKKGLDDFLQYTKIMKGLGVGNPYPANKIHQQFPWLKAAALAFGQVELSSLFNECFTGIEAQLQETGDNFKIERMRKKFLDAHPHIKKYRDQYLKELTVKYPKDNDKVNSMQTFDFEGRPGNWSHDLLTEKYLDIVTEIAERKNELFDSVVGLFEKMPEIEYLRNHNLHYAQEIRKLEMLHMKTESVQIPDNIQDLKAKIRENEDEIYQKKKWFLKNPPSDEKIRQKIEELQSRKDKKTLYQYEIHRRQNAFWYTPEFLEKFKDDADAIHALNQQIHRILTVNPLINVFNLTIIALNEWAKLINISFEKAQDRLEGSIQRGEGAKDLLYQAKASLLYQFISEAPDKKVVKNLSDIKFTEGFTTSLTYEKLKTLVEAAGKLYVGGHNFLRPREVTNLLEQIKNDSSPFISLQKIICSMQKNDATSLQYNFIVVWLQDAYALDDSILRDPKALIQHVKNAFQPLDMKENPAIKPTRQATAISKTKVVSPLMEAIACQDLEKTKILLQKGISLSELNESVGLIIALFGKNLHQNENMNLLFCLFAHGANPIHALSLCFLGNKELNIYQQCEAFIPLMQHASSQKPSSKHELLAMLFLNFSERCTSNSGMKFFWQTTDPIKTRAIELSKECQQWGDKPEIENMLRGKIKEDGSDLDKFLKFLTLNPIEEFLSESEQQVPQNKIS